MNTLRTVVLTSWLLCLSATASTWDDIARLDAAKATRQDTSAQTRAADHPPFRLSDGRAVRVEDWKLVLFMQSTCSYCHQFDPVLKQISEQTGIAVFPYSLDGRGDAAFPAALPAGPDVMVEFFNNGLPIATPTVFLVNVNTMMTFPMFQGAVAADVFMTRLDEVFQVALSAGGRHATR
ncbi:type-F conjugative transfer system pilin assembly thiol-disulfide isomerase TrbB [Aeromonas salmonicida]|uniref:IncF plasmid conjugative transfer protein TrbB n=2 Tax=Aeromonas salmonicida subsp. salmonicida TaxID=29491 RepID=A0A1Z3MNM7_AERSS|nr:MULTISPECIES: type-F conjugative transfer system pilin assembly thiol-disulfide isomerase TrbB [Aeromonas]ASD49383.1 IncF plasmid conjugative transfer protein TrbB [Aeromonas salmonicida subsp. salmonicida]OAH74984.1 conjugal transfer protein TrbB [Aeromonas salmonicida subsp. salmonicida]OKA73175.1 type-F conjugative transfer system pilin assembly thiol-disulfide isomerase TrbB [Aeromonas salmonicida subsp. salmonicida]QEO86309.1 type-F conjugative transfer system pilin assembly thiol-disul